MISTDSVPVGGPLTQCEKCGLRARPPIVIPGSLVGYGKCQNEKACSARQAKQARLNPSTQQEKGK